MKGIIYQIFIESHPNIHYVGSTIRSLEQRWQQHKSDFKTKSKRIPVICKYFEEFCIDNFQIRLIKEYEVIDRKHLLAYEQLWINKLKPINLVKTLLSIKKIKAFHKKIYKENNREYFLEIGRLYRETNKEYLREKKKELYICPCCPNKEQMLGGKSRHIKTLKHIKYIESTQETKE